MNFMDPNRPLVNAKAETVHEKRSFAKSFREKRCLVPATGFFDYRGSDPKGKKRRYLFETDDKFYVFAGLWQESGGVRYYTIITTEPNDVVKEFHHRMPVILRKADYERWLDPKSTEEELRAMLTPWAGKMTATEAPKGGAAKAAEPEPENHPKKPKAEKRKPASERTR
jgi:putative SOS response-associated peptidase YedK